MSIPQTMAVGLAGSFIAGIIVYAISGGSAAPGLPRRARLLRADRLLHPPPPRRRARRPGRARPAPPRALERAHRVEQPLDVVLVVVVHEAGAHGAVGVEAEEALELLGVVVAVPDRDLALGERGGDLRRSVRPSTVNISVDVRSRARPWTVTPGIASSPSSAAASSASSCARTASQSMPRV